MDPPRSQTPKNPKMKPIPPIRSVNDLENGENKQEITSGPAEYSANPWAALVVGLCFVFITLQKCALVWMECERKWGTFRLIATSLYFLSIFNVYLPYSIKYQLYMTFSCFRNLLIFPFFYCYLLDNFIFLGVPIASHFIQANLSTNSDDNILLETILGCSICIFSSLAFWLARIFPTISYKPLELSERFLLSDSTQYSHETDKNLTIVESSSFKIVILNSGENPLPGPLMVKRTVTRSGRTKICDLEKDIINFTVKLDGPLDSDQQIILIPETHNLEGAKKIKNLRSFGKNRGLRVETEIVLGKRGNLSHVKDISIYKLL